MDIERVLRKNLIVVKESPKKKKMETVMHEYGKGDLKSSSGEKVKDKKQALAIAFSEADRHAKKANTGNITELKDQKMKVLHNVDPRELMAGIDVEFEHTNDRQIAEKIARDHLSEDREYYTKLKQVETE